MKGLKFGALLVSLLLAAFSGGDLCNLNYVCSFPKIGQNSFRSSHCSVNC